MKSFGGKGSGPGEFQNIGRMYWLPDGRLIVTDYRSRRTSFFKTDGEFLNSFQWKTFLSGVYLTTDSSFTCEENDYGEDKKLYIKTFNFKVEELLNYGEFTPVGFHTLRSGDMSFAISLPYDSKSVFRGDQKKQWLYHCFNNEYTIEVYDQDGKLFKKSTDHTNQFLSLKKIAMNIWRVFHEEMTIQSSQKWQKKSSCLQ